MNAKLTSEQREKLKPGLGALGRAHEAWSAELRSVLGEDGGGGPAEGTSCFDCNCGRFVAPANGSRMRCNRDGCGHPEWHHFLP